MRCNFANNVFRKAVAIQFSQTNTSTVAAWPGGGGGVRPSSNFSEYLRVYGVRSDIHAMGERQLVLCVYSLLR